MVFELDKETVKRKLEHLKNPRAFTKDGMPRNLWRPDPEKENQIRIFANPLAKNPAEDPFLDLWLHYDIAGRRSGIICLEKQYTQQCPICDLGRKLSKSSVKEDKDLAKKLFPTQRFFALMVDRTDPTLTPKYWNFGKTIYTKLLEYTLMPDYCTYLDPIQGLDCTIKVVQLPNKKFPEPTLVFCRRESRLSSTDEQIKKIMSSVVPFEEVFKAMTSVEINKLLDQWLSFPGQEKEEIVKGNINKEENNNENFESSVDEVERAFEKALEDI